MSRWWSALLLLVAAAASGARASCSNGDGDVKAKAGDPENYHEVCIVALRTQIRKEFEASIQYLLMGAYFAQDNVNLHGFAEMFFEHADEERQHGIMFIEYLRHRGDTDTSFLSDTILPILGKSTWTDGEEALRDALTMEKTVTGSIKKLIDACDNDQLQDYSAADWLTSTWLEEQLAGQKDLAVKINTLSNFRRDHESLADWMFSNQILKAMNSE